MARAKNWQVRVTWPGHPPRVMTFGVKAPTRAAARRRARAIIAGGGAQLRVTRLYGRHHPMRKTVGREEQDDPGDAALPSPGERRLAQGHQGTPGLQRGRGSFALRSAASRSPAVRVLPMSTGRGSNDDDDG